MNVGGTKVTPTAKVKKKTPTPRQDQLDSLLTTTKRYKDILSTENFEVLNKFTKAVQFAEGLAIKRTTTIPLKEKFSGDRIDVFNYLASTNKTTGKTMADAALIQQEVAKAVTAAESRIHDQLNTVQDQLNTVELNRQADVRILRAEFTAQNLQTNNDMNSRYKTLEDLLTTKIDTSSDDMKQFFLDNFSGAKVSGAKNNKNSKKRKLDNGGESDQTEEGEDEEGSEEDNQMDTIAANFNYLIEASVFPPDWKEGLIVPIYKGAGSFGDPSSYRPITLLGVESRLFERHLESELRGHVEREGLLPLPRP